MVALRLALVPADANDKAAETTLAVLAAVSSFAIDESGSRLSDHDLNRVAKKLFSAADGSASSNPAKLPRSASSRAARRKPPQAARANAEATDTRRTPSAASPATEPCFGTAITLTGFGETAATITEMA